MVAHAQLKVGDNPGTINKSSVLELESLRQGLLLTRIPDTTLAPLTTAPDGMIIFLTTDKTLRVRSNGAWVRLSSLAEASANWSLTGNAGIDPTLNYLGTKDAQPLSLRTNALEAIHINTDQSLQFKAVPNSTALINALVIDPTTGAVNQRTLSVAAFGDAIRSLNGLTNKGITIKADTIDATNFGVTATAADSSITVNIPRVGAISQRTGLLTYADWLSFSAKQQAITIGAFSNTPSATGLTLSAGVLTLTAADATNPGAVSIGTQTFAGAKTFNDPLTAASNATVGGNLAVTGTSTLTGATTVGSTLGVTGATTLSNTLGVTGATTLGSTLGVTGATTLGNTLSVAGASTLTGATTVGSTLGVTGATTLSDNLSVAGTSTLTGNTTVGGTLGVTGASTLNGATTINNTAHVTGNTTLDGALNLTTAPPDAATTENTVLIRDATTGAIEKKVLNPAAFQGAIQSLDGQTGPAVSLQTGKTGTDVNVDSVSSANHIFINIPDAAVGARGVVTTGAQTFAGAKTFRDTVSVGANAVIGTLATNTNPAPNSTLQLNGSMSLAIRTLSASATLTSSDNTVLVDTTPGATTITLPAAANIIGRVYTIKKIAGGIDKQLTITPSGGTIEGGANYVIYNDYTYVSVQTDGTNWYVIRK